MYQALINQNELLCRCAQWLNTGAQEVMSNIWLIVSFESLTMIKTIPQINLINTVK